MSADGLSWGYPRSIPGAGSRSVPPVPRHRLLRLRLVTPSWWLRLLPRPRSWCFVLYLGCIVHWCPREARPSVTILERIYPPLVTVACDSFSTAFAVGRGRRSVGFSALGWPHAPCAPVFLSVALQRSVTELRKTLRLRSVSLCCPSRFRCSRVAVEESGLSLLLFSSRAHGAFRSGRPQTSPLTPHRFPEACLLTAQARLLGTAGRPVTVRSRALLCFRRCFQSVRVCARERRPRRDVGERWCSLARAVCRVLANLLSVRPSPSFLAWSLFSTLLAGLSLGSWAPSASPLGKTF